MPKKREKLPNGVTVRRTTPEELGVRTVRGSMKATACHQVERKGVGRIGGYYYREGSGWFWRPTLWAAWSPAETERAALSAILNAPTKQPAVAAAAVPPAATDAQRFNLPPSITLDRGIPDAAARAEHYTSIRKGAERLGWFFKDSRESNAASWAPWVWSSNDGRMGHCENENACIRHILTPPTTAPPPAVPPPPAPKPDSAFAELALHEIVQAAIEDARSGKPVLLRSLLHALFEILKTSPTPEWLTKILPAFVGVGLSGLALWSALKRGQDGSK